MPGNTSPFLEFQKITAYQQDTLVLENLSLRIEEGERVAILGPNGAGKSSLLKLISRELYPVHSNDSWLRLFGQERFTLWDLRKKLGFVSLDLQQDYSEDTGVLDVVLSGFFGAIGQHDHLVPTDQQIEEAGRMLELVGMSHYQNRAYQQLSTGQKRRLLLARALVHQPRALILDEPTVGLDMGGTAQLLTLLRQFVADSRTLLITTHHIEEVIPETDRVILLGDGRVMADGAKHEVLTTDSLSALYGVHLQVQERDGWYRCWYQSDL